MSEEHASAETSVFRTHQIASAIDEHLRRQAVREVVSDEAFIEAHPELMPQLGEELRKWRLIRAALEAASQSPDSVGSVRGKLRDSQADEDHSTGTSHLDDSVTQARIHSETPHLTNAVLPEAMRIGPYEIVQVLGEGGYGVVYLAKDVDLERPVAIKIAKQDADRSSEQVRTFLGEARRVAQLKHPSIVSVLDVSRGEADAWYLVMEYIEGPTLANVFAEGHLSTLALVELLVQVADAIHHAHSNGILHRDLKPSNVLLDKSQQRAHIVDFGMALHAGEQLFAPRSPVGTPYCMAPEQVRGETHRLDARTDIWSIGVMMYQGLAGRRPFAGEHVSGLFNVILKNDPEPLKQINSCIPAELERICLKCLSKRMADRYASAADLATDLRRWLTDSSKVMVKSASATEGRNATDEAAGKAPVVPKGLRSFGSEDAGFFLDLLPGPRNRDGLPESVHTWIKSVENRERRPERAVLVLYGPIGSGKSSFVSAGILPRLSQSTSIVWGDATTRDLPQDILNKLHRVCPDLPTRADLPSACDLIRRGIGQHADRKVLIVLDQFEQWLHANNGCLSGPFAAALRHCDGERLQCLIIVRSDFWLGITRFMQELEIPLVEGSNSAHLDLFDARHARKVLTLFGQSYGCLPPDGTLDGQYDQFLDQAVEQIAKDGWVTPVRLALLAEMVRGQEWTASTLKKLGGERGVGVAFLEQAFGSSLAAPSHRRYRRAAEAVLRALLPEPGVDIKGRSRTEDELMQASGYKDKQQQFSELIEILDSQLRLITPTEAAEAVVYGDNDDASSANLPAYRPSFQLTHDYLVPALREWLTRGQQSTRSGRAQLCLEERDKQWQRAPTARSLPSLAETVRISAFTERKSWTASQTSMMRKATGLHLKRAALWTAAAAALSAVIYAMIPPDPLMIFLDSNQPVAARIAAFDHLDASSDAALWPVLATIKREPEPDVLRHATEGLPALCERMQLTGKTRELVASDIADYLRHEQLLDDSLRNALFTIYATLAKPDDVIALGVDVINQHGDSIWPILAKYIETLDARELFAIHPSGPNSFVSNDTRRLVSNLIRLMNALPEEQDRHAPARILAGLPPQALLDSFVAAFSGETATIADESTAIYVRALPREQRPAEATRLLAELGRRLSASASERSTGRESRTDVLEYVLNSIRHLQAFNSHRDGYVFGQIRDLLDKREAFRSGSVLDVACRAYAAMYRLPQNRDEPSDPLQLAPLQSILHAQDESVDVRCAAATALGDTGEPAIVTDLAAVAQSPTEKLRLRAAAVQGLAAIGRVQVEQNQHAEEVAQVLFALLDTERYQSEQLFEDVSHDYASVAGQEDLPHILALLSLPVRNFSAQRGIYTFLLRFPDATEQIARDTLVAVSLLSDAQKSTLFPGPASMLAEIPQVYRHDRADPIERILLELAEALAKLAAKHPDSPVRVLAQQNLQRIVILIKGLPPIDPEAVESVREQQWSKWEKAWTTVLPTLELNEASQLEDRVGETP